MHTTVTTEHVAVVHGRVDKVIVIGIHRVP